MGVWIETVMMVRSMRLYRVTPCVGVWIETLQGQRNGRRGLVTPCVGVWIETDPSPSRPIKPKSHPAWVCGLKQIER